MLKLPRLNVEWNDQPGLFQRYWNSAMGLIEDNVNGIAAALAAAVAAQTSADSAGTAAVAAQTDATSALANAATAQSTATSALTTATNAVPKHLGPTWSGTTGGPSRAAYTIYTAPTISNPPTQAEVQAIANALNEVSAHVIALINDLQANGALS